MMPTKITKRRKIDENLEQGIDDVAQLATADGLERVTGQHLDGGPPTNANSPAYDAVARRRLAAVGDESLECTGVAS